MKFFGERDFGTRTSPYFPENEGTKDFALEKGTKAPEGTGAGAGTGAVAGGVLGWLVGIGALAIPGLGPFLAAGPIVAALAGVGAGGMVGGLVRCCDRPGHRQVTSPDWVEVNQRIRMASPPGS